LEDQTLAAEKKKLIEDINNDIKAEKKREKDIETAAKEAKKNKDLADKQAKKDAKDIEAAAKKAKQEEIKKQKEEASKLKAEKQADPFRNRLQGIYKDSKQEVTFLYDKLNSFFPLFNSAQAEAKKTALNTLKAGYEEFDKVYAKTGSAFKGMWASVNAMFKISPITVIMAGLTTAFIGILGAANRLNSKIKEISAELGTSNMQSYEFFKNAMNAQTQYDNMYASLRDVRDVQKGILGDSGILLQVNDKALASIADNAKNIGVSTEGAGAFVEALRTKGATDVEAANLAAASLELADKSKFIMPQSVMDDIAQNVEFSSKYFSNINKDSKSAQQHLVDTNLQVKALGLNFQKAAKMTQHLLSFEQSIVSEVEASVALGRHVNIGKARELLLQDDIGGAMQQMMDTMGGYDAFQDMDFAKRQLMANAMGLEVSELEKSLYLRDKIGITNEEALNAAMKNSDYLDKVAGKNVELYKVEAKKVLAAEQFNTAVEKVGVAFKLSLLPVLLAILPIVEMMASAINFVAGGVKTIVGLPGKLINKITGQQPNPDGSSSTSGLEASMNIGMISVMGGLLLKTLKGKLGGKIGEVVGKARGGLDALTGTLGTKTNPMYVISLGGGGGSGGGVSDIVSTVLDNAGGASATGTATAGTSKLSKLKDFLSKGGSKIKTFTTGAPAKIGKVLDSLKNIKPSSIAKIGGVMAVAAAAFDYSQRKKEGQSTKQAATASIGGALGGITGGAVTGAAAGALLGPIGAAIGGLIGGTAGYLATTKIIDSQFDKNKSSSFTAQPFMYAGMNGMSGGGGISTSLNKPKAKGTPVETSMVDMTPTTFKSMSSGISGITPNYGTTSTARESVMVNSVSKSVEATALMKSVKEKNIEKEKAHKEMMEQQLKILESIREKINQPAVAFFTEEGRRQVINQSRVKNSH
jgi:vacuolar-type H+-ATPase subunit H